MRTTNHRPARPSAARPEPATPRRATPRPVLGDPAAATASRSSVPVRRSCSLQSGALSDDRRGRPLLPQLDGPGGAASGQAVQVTPRPPLRRIAFPLCLKQFTIGEPAEDRIQGSRGNSGVLRYVVAVAPLSRLREQSGE